MTARTGPASEAARLAVAPAFAAKRTRAAAGDPGDSTAADGFVADGPRMSDDAHPVRSHGSRWMRRVGAALLAGLYMANASASPALPAHTLDGRALRVPSDLRGGISLLVIGYSRRSRTQTAACLRRLGDSPLREGLQVYQVVVLGSAPRLLRGAIVSAIRREVPVAQHARFLVIGDEEHAWKAATGYGDDDAAHLLLVDGARIVWRGGCDATTVDTLRHRLQRVTAGPGVP